MFRKPEYISSSADHCPTVSNGKDQQDSEAVPLGFLCLGAAAGPILISGAYGRSAAPRSYVHDENIDFALDKKEGETSRQQLWRPRPVRALPHQA